MRIKIKNIFNNGNKDKFINKLNNKKQEKIKKIENVKCLENLEIEEKIVCNVKKVRKGYIQEEINKDTRSKKKLIIYLGNFLKNKNKLSKVYYFLFIAMLGLGCGSVYIAGKTYGLFSKEEYNVYSSIDSLEEVQVFNNSQDDNIISNQKTQDDVTNNVDTKVVQSVDKKNENVSNNEVVKKTVEKTVKVPIVKIDPLVFIKPIEGEILKIFSIDKVIYSKTLELWKIHDGIDIKADIGTNVKSIEKGIVEKVYEDSFYGVTIVIDHGQGYKSIYSNLDKKTSVETKQSVTKGKVIGKISNTSIGEIKDESHLHFGLMKDNNIVNPSSIFN